MGRARGLAVMGAPVQLGEGGAAAQSWDFTADTWDGAWSVAGGVLVPSVTLGSELVTNGDMETGDPPDGWVAVNATISADIDAHTGTQALRVALTSAGARAYNSVSSLDIGSFLIFEGWGKINAGSSAFAWVYGTSGGNYFIKGVGGTYTQVRRALRTRDTLLQLRGSTDNSGNFDDYSLKVIDVTTALDGISYTATAKATANITVPDGYIGGVGQYHDSTNWIFCYVDPNRTKLIIDKSVAGTCTPLVAQVAITYADDASIALERVGDGTYNAYYNGSKVVDAALIADSVFASAKNWGPFATDAGVTFSAFALDPV